MQRSDSPVPAPARETTRAVDYRERCAVAANMHAFEARSWQEKLDADPTDEDARMEVADETRRSRDMAALATALDALAEAWNDPRYGQRMRQHITEGYPRLSAAIHTLTDSPTP